MSLRKVAEEIARERNMHPQQVESLIRDALRRMLTHAMSSGRCLVMGVGSFYRHDSPERAARNPRSGEHHMIPPRSLVRFRQAPAPEGQSSEGQHVSES